MSAPASLDPAYRPCVGILIFNEMGQVFVARRIDAGIDSWQMPQGGIDKDECPRAAALREVREEIGTDRVEIIAESRSWLSYDLPPGLAGRLWGGFYRGQVQKWFAARFTGSDADIDLDTHSAEFNAWRWVDIAQLAELIVDFKRPVYEAVVAEFRHLAVAR